MYLVEIPVAESDLPGRMMAMRAWLDHQRFEPDTFRYTPSAWKDGVFRVEFKVRARGGSFRRSLWWPSGRRIECRCRAGIK